jgi:hypothetical protein
MAGNSEKIRASSFPNAVNGVSFPTSQKTILKIDRVEARMLELDDVLYHTNSAVLMPEIPEVSSTSPSNKCTGLKALALGFKQLEFDSQQKILIAAHTDTKGEVTDNFTLSKKRGQGIYCLLTSGKREDWAENSKNQHVIEDYQQILKYMFERHGWAGCDPGPINNKWNKETKSATEAFIDKYNDELAKTSPPPAGINPIDKKSTIYFVQEDWQHHWVIELWRAVYDIYISDIIKALGVDADLFEKRYRSKVNILKGGGGEHYLACGESHPIDQSLRNEYRSQKNRRVEIYFFKDNDLHKAWPQFIKWWLTNPCPTWVDKVHGPAVCPLWQNLLIKKIKIEDDDLTCVGYHLRFDFWERKNGTKQSLPEGLQINAFSDVLEKQNLNARVSYLQNSGVYLVKVPENKVQPPHIHFSFNSIQGADTTPRWVQLTPGSPPGKLLGKIVTEDEIKKNNGNITIYELPLEKQLDYYDIPAQWCSLNYFTRSESDFDTGDSFGKVLNDKKYKPFGDKITTSTSPLVFSLDDIVLLDSAGGTQAIRDADHRAPNLNSVPSAANPPHYPTLSNDSRIKIFVADKTSGRLKLYQTGATFDTARVAFPKNYISVKKDDFPFARIVFFRDGFYPIGWRRTTATSGWQADGFVVGARAALRNDSRHHAHHEMFLSHHEFSDTGDYDLHYFHHMFLKGGNPVSYLIYYVSISFMADTRDWTTAPPHPPKDFKIRTIPTDNDVQNFIDLGVYNAMDVWNQKGYFFEEISPGPQATVVMPHYFFDERATFKVTRPTAGFHIDFHADSNNHALFSHAAIRAAQSRARGGRSKFMAFIGEDESNHWGPAYGWPVRTPGGQNYSIFYLNKTSFQSWNDIYNPENPVTEHGDIFQGFIMAHELGHATGNPDEYVNDGYKPYDKSPDTYAEFDQYYVPYSMAPNGTSMMCADSAPRLHHCWYGLHRLNASIDNAHHVLHTMLSGKKFAIRLDRGAPWVYTFNRHLDKTDAQFTQKPRRLVTPMHHAAQHEFSKSPLKRINLAIYDTARDESSTRYFHANQATGPKPIEYQAVLVVRVLFGIEFIGSNWNDGDRDLAISDLNTAFISWREQYRLINGSKDIKNVYIHFVPGFHRGINNGNQNYGLRMDHGNHPGGSTPRFPNNSGTITFYFDVPGSELLEYILNTTVHVGDPNAVNAIRDWANTAMKENFSVEKF